MTTIPGASGFLNSATLANTRGLAAQSATVLGAGGIGGVDILDVARANAPSNGVGLSSRARLLNQQFLDSTSSTFNQIFSLGIGATASIDGLQQQILALRSGLSDSQLAPSLRQDNGEAAAPENGQTVDTTA
ncbi:MAG: hypothetical protein AB8B83_04805 [Bdellovibrionales bacterium]